MDEKTELHEAEDVSRRNFLRTGAGFAASLALSSCAPETPLSGPFANQDAFWEANTPTPENKRHENGRKALEALTLETYTAQETGGSVSYAIPAGLLGDMSHHLDKKGHLLNLCFPKEGQKNPPGILGLYAKGNEIVLLSYTDWEEKLSALKKAIKGAIRGPDLMPRGKMKVVFHKLNVSEDGWIPELVDAPHRKDSGLPKGFSGGETIHVSVPEALADFRPDQWKNPTEVAKAFGRKPGDSVIGRFTIDKIVPRDVAFDPILAGHLNKTHFEGVIGPANFTECMEFLAQAQKGEAIGKPQFVDVDARPGSAYAVGVK